MRGLIEVHISERKMEKNIGADFLYCKCGGKFDVSVSKSQDLLEITFVCQRCGKKESFMFEIWCGGFHFGKDLSENADEVR